MFTSSWPYSFGVGLQDLHESALLWLWAGDLGGYLGRREKGSCTNFLPSCLSLSRSLFVQGEGFRNLEEKLEVISFSLSSVSSNSLSTVSIFSLCLTSLMGLKVRWWRRLFWVSYIRWVWLIFHGGFEGKFHGLLCVNDFMVFSVRLVIGLKNFQLKTE